MEVLWRPQQSCSTSNPNITKGLIHSIMSNSNFSRSKLRAVTCIYKIAIKNLHLLLTSPKTSNLCFNSLKTKTWERNMKTRQMVPLFHLILSYLWHSFLYMGKANIYFHVFLYLVYSGLLNTLILDQQGYQFRQAVILF